MHKKIQAYLLDQANKTTAWIGFIGIILLILNMHNLMLILFAALIVLPEGQFSQLFKRWTKEINESLKVE